MSIWGKVSGAATGLFVAGPVGALVGAVAGHFFLDRDSDPGVTFTIAIIALAGKMAKADGVVSEEEFDVFRRVFVMPPEEEANVRRIFNLARQDMAGFEHYAGQIASLFRGNPAVLEDVLDGLFEIAKADGVLHPCEAQLPGTGGGDFRLRPQRISPHPRQPFRAGTDRPLCHSGPVLCRRTITSCARPIAAWCARTIPTA